MKLFFTFLIILLPYCLFSQDTLLTLKTVVEISLKNNYDIRIAQNIFEQQENNNTIGNAGMLPDVDATGAYVRSSNSLKQEYNNGTEVNRDASIITNTVGDIGLVWTIFDGTKMFSTKSKLSEFSFQSYDQLKIQIENSLQDVITAYYVIVRQQQLLKALREEIRFSEERLKISERKMNNGSGSRLDWLQTKTDYNRQIAAELSLFSQADEAKFKLNELMGRKTDTQFSIEDTVIISYNPNFEELKKSVVEQNNELSFYRRNQRIAELELKENKSLRWPVINLTSHYIYSKNTSEAGFTLLNQQQGFNYGATATIPLFHGFNINRQVKNARLAVVNSEIVLESANARVNQNLLIAWTVFNNNLKLLQLEEQNIILAREVLSISQERYKIGVSNIIEQQDAQNTFEQAMIRLADARFNAKISETVLRRLNGELVTK